MKSIGNTIKLLTLAFTGIFLLNMLIMYVLFDTDVFNPLGIDTSKANIAGIRFNPEPDISPEPSQNEAYPQSSPAADDDYYSEYIHDTPLLPEKYGVGDPAATPDPDSTYFMTTGEVGFLENLSLLDKLDALSLISKVGREEADKIYDLAADGVTYAEMEDIRAVLAKYLNRDEMEKLTGLLNKSKRQYSEANE